ncbi:MAG: phosphoribosylanthranilate isomerase [Chloroflexi bacterium]|nr:phosphoribosylanthranilate isomerase [Chloroflexota bacterium]
MTRIKVCGITTLDDALLCAREGVDLLGLNFYPPSPRSIAPEAARVLTGALRAELGAACPLLLGVFVNEDPGAIIQIIDFVGLDGAQLSGDESAESLAALQGRAVKAIRPRSAAEAAEHAARYLPHAPADDRLPAVLVDAYHKALYGGTGEQASLEVARSVQALTPRMMLAGGLAPDNVGERVRLIQPWGVDVASGVENGQPGIKDHGLVRALVAAVRAVAADPARQ